MDMYTNSSQVDPSLLTGSLHSKRRKTPSTVNTPQRGPLSLISSHTAPVQSAIFNPLDPTVAYSCSLDHTVRTFDLTTSTLVDTRTTSHPLYSLTALPGISSQILAAGTSARHITLLDPRVEAKSTQVMTLRGHTNLVSSLCADPHSNYGLVSGSNDGTCRVYVSSLPSSSLPPLSPLSPPFPYPPPYFHLKLTLPQLGSPLLPPRNKRRRLRPRRRSHVHHRAQIPRRQEEARRRRGHQGLWRRLE